MRVEHNRGASAILYHFDDCHDYADTVAKRCTPVNHGSWAGGESWDEAMRKAKYGDQTLVPQAEALIEKISVEAQRELPVWTPSVAGAFPMVAEYLMDRPDCMRRRHPTPDERAPIRIYVELTSSGGISASDMQKRGTAILALALLLNTHRACELHAIVGLDARVEGARASFCVVRLGSSPLDISSACNALTSVGFVRSMGYQMLDQSPESRASGGWAWDLHPVGSGRTLYVEKLRKALNASPTDMIIPPIHVHDTAVTDPVGFVQRALDEALQVEREAE
jgi:hypothetical protein